MAADFGVGAVCIESDGLDTTFADLAAPPIATGYSYLIRVHNDCPAEQMGFDPSGHPRTGPGCP
jgi:hypothetical protein